MGWRVIKPYIYNQSPNQESLPCHSNDPDLMSQLHSDEWLQYGFMFIFYNLTLNTVILAISPCKIVWQEQLSEFSMWRHTKTLSERRKNSADQTKLKVFWSKISPYSMRDTWFFLNTVWQNCDWHLSLQSFIITFLTE